MAFSESTVPLEQPTEIRHHGRATFSFISLFYQCLDENVQHAHQRHHLSCQERNQ